jgi:hypothetical protein
MDGIRRKSAIQKTGEIILSLFDRGEDLLWGRYERQLPLCGFTDNGLNCRRCFNGPCRINPFGDEPDRGVCGADRDQIVMETIFQATLGGVLETAQALSIFEETAGELPDISMDLPGETRERLSAARLLPVYRSQLGEVQNSYFSHKGYLGRTLKDLIRLGLIHYGLLKKIGDADDKLRGLEGPPDNTGANLLFVGQPSAGLWESLKKHAAEQNPKINLWGNGSSPASPFPLLSDHGTPELALAMNLDALILAPNAGLPSLGPLAEKLGIPVILVEDCKTPEQTVVQAIDAALRHRGNAIASGPFPVPSRSILARNPTVFEKSSVIKGALKSGRVRGVAVIIGEGNVKQTLFERTLSLMEKCLEQKCLVFLAGGLAAQSLLLEKELKARKGSLYSAWEKELEPSGIDPLTGLGGFGQIPALVAFLRNLGERKEFAALPAVISFPEFYRTATWALAVSFVALGFTVQIGARLPFWGSPAVSEILRRDWPEISGGALLASASLPDAQTQAQQLISTIDATGKE